MYIVDMNNDDFVLYQQGGEFISGGYSINSFFLREGMEPMKSFNNDLHSDLNENLSGGSKKNDVSSSFESFAVPAGLFYIHHKKNKHYGGDHADEHKNKDKDNYVKQHNMLPDDIYDKLFQLAQYNKKTKLTKKNKKSPLKKTRRNINEKI
jgi:hypothetical protein